MPKHARFKEDIDTFSCEECKVQMTMDDVYGRVTYMSGLYGFWCKPCWNERNKANG